MIIRRSSRRVTSYVEAEPLDPPLPPIAAPPVPVTAASLFGGSATQLASVKFGDVIWGNMTPHVSATVVNTNEFIVKPGFVITGVRFVTGSAIDRLDGLYIRPCQPPDLSGPEEFVRLTGFGGPGGRDIVEEKATAGYALSAIKVGWYERVFGLQCRWRNFQVPWQYQNGNPIGWIREWTCTNGPFPCGTDGLPMKYNGNASPRYTRPPPRFIVDALINAPVWKREDADTTYQTIDDSRFSDVNEPVVLFATAVRIKNVAYYSGVVGGIQLGYQDFSAVRKVQTDDMLQRLCCLGKGDPFLCGSQFYGSTPSCDAIMSSACSSLSREEVMATPVCRCYTSLIKAPVCYDKKCLDVAAYRPAVMLKTFSPCPDLLECNQYLGLPEEVKDSVVNNVALQQTCTKNDGTGGGATPINDPDPNNLPDENDTDTVTYGANDNMGKVVAGAALSVVGLAITVGFALN